MTKRAIAKKLSEETLFPASYFDVDALCKAALIRPYDVKDVEVSRDEICLYLKGFCDIYGDEKCVYRDPDGSFLYVGKFLR